MDGTTSHTDLGQRFGGKFILVSKVSVTSVTVSVTTWIATVITTWIATVITTWITTVITTWIALQTYFSKVRILVLLGCYRKKMNAKDKEFYDIVFKNCTEEEIYAILLKKKEIDDITPKMRTGDDNRMLKSLFNKMRKFPKDLI